METFRVWAGACSHVHSDLKFGRRSLGEAFEQSESGGSEGGPAFDWDIMLHLGDISGTQTPPADEDGPPVLEQFRALRKHRREDVYCLLGNHDASGPGEETQWWFRKWIDPTGENTAVSGVDPALRRFPVTGTWERYHFTAGNILFLMIGDRNDGGPPKGRGERGGYPAGAITRETWEWWREQVEANEERIVVTCMHHVLRDTTTASGRNEGVPGGYHKRFVDEAGASYLYWVGDDTDTSIFHDYFDAHPSAIDLWLAGHTHTHPDDRYGGKELIARRWNITFANCAALTRHHGDKLLYPMSRLVTFTRGSNRARIQCYMHTSHYRPQGWYAAAEREVELRYPFRP
ncbi:MAG: metallophosphoesterase [Burkholderiales bacterium]|nr:metallophosphoesterase [Burkholderiales bacterium]